MDNLPMIISPKERTNWALSLSAYHLEKEYYAVASGRQLEDSGEDSGMKCCESLINLMLIRILGSESLKRVHT